MTQPLESHPSPAIVVCLLSLWDLCWKRQAPPIPRSPRLFPQDRRLHGLARSTVPTGTRSLHWAREHCGWRPVTHPGTPLGHHSAFPDFPHLLGQGTFQAPVPHGLAQPWLHLRPLGQSYSSHVDDPLVLKE